jgi:hypothetical protein
MHFRNANAVYVCLFFKKKALLYDEDLFNYRNDRDLTLFANWWNHIDRATDGNILDLDPLMNDLLRDVFFYYTGNARNADGVTLQTTADDRNLLLKQQKRSTNGGLISFQGHQTIHRCP